MAAIATKEEKPEEIPASLKRAHQRGFSGKCAKIRILEVPGQDRLVQITLGDLPVFNVVRNKDWIIPVEYLGVLNDTAVETKEPVLMMYPDPATGNPFVYVPTVKNLFPYQHLGEATWDEYEKFSEDLRTKGLK